MKRAQPGPSGQQQRDNNERARGRRCEHSFARRKPRAWGGAAHYDTGPITLRLAMCVQDVEEGGIPRGVRDPEESVHGQEA